MQISPDHCSCSNDSSCVLIVDLTETLNLFCLTSNCSLASYISQHLDSDHKKIVEGYFDHNTCGLRGDLPQHYSDWIGEYILPYSPSSNLLNKLI